MSQNFRILIFEDDAEHVQYLKKILHTPGCELGGGSVRIHDQEMQKAVFKVLGISDEEAEEKFGFLLNALKFGAPPHAGLAFGLDRLIMLITPLIAPVGCPLLEVSGGSAKKARNK